MARQYRVKIDWPKVKKLAYIQCTCSEIACVLDVSPDTLERACKREYDRTIGDYVAEYSQGGKASLRRMQFKSAESGSAAMLIWLGKQYLNQKDRQEFTGDSKLVLNYRIDELDRHEDDEDDYGFLD